MAPARRPRARAERSRRKAGEAKPDPAREEAERINAQKIAMAMKKKNKGKAGRDEGQALCARVPSQVLRTSQVRRRIFASIHRRAHCG